MRQIRTALEQTTTHGLNRTVSKKPLYVRVAWLLLYLTSLGLFLKGFSEFVIKLRSRQVTSSIDSNAIPFKYPDIYACFENSVSTSYAAAASNQTISYINHQLTITSDVFARIALAANLSSDSSDELERMYSFAYIQSLQYRQLVDAFAHRLEQSLITSDVSYVSQYGLPTSDPLAASEFYHPVSLRCVRWVLNDSVRDTLAKSGTFGGLTVALLTDANFSSTSPSGPPIARKVFAGGSPIPVSDWSLSRLDFDDPDRKAGVRVYLCPPGEYPTEFVTSFSLGPGRYHTVEISMTEQLYNSLSFDCINDPPDQVQFVNPYSQEPYNHNYSYSYCYYLEYHRQYQAIMNLSGDASPLPWPVRGHRFLFNLSGDASNFLQQVKNLAAGLLTDNDLLSRVSDIAQTRCSNRAPCRTINYDPIMSNSDWPTYSSTEPFIASTIAQAFNDAHSANLSTPSLAYLMGTNLSTARAYINANLLKVTFKPRRQSCNRVTLSIDYGFGNFVSDVGGIMGIYLGMSLLTVCELLELIYDLLVAAFMRRADRVQETVLTMVAKRLTHVLTMVAKRLTRRSTS